MARLCRSAGHTGVCAGELLAGKDNVVGSAREGGRRGDLLGAGQRNTEQAQARKEFELERVVSCGQWWRTKLNFRSREPFDDHHWCTTLGTVPSIAAMGEGRVLELLFWLYPQ